MGPLLGHLAVRVRTPQDLASSAMDLDGFVGSTVWFKAICFETAATILFGCEGGCVMNQLNCTRAAVRYVIER